MLIRIDKLQIPEPKEIKTPKFNKKKNELLMDKGVKIKPNNKISKPNKNDSNVENGVQNNKVRTYMDHSH